MTSGNMYVETMVELFIADCTTFLTVSLQLQGHQYIFITYYLLNIT